VSEPVSILFVFGWLVVGGEETEVRLLARTLDPARYKIDVVACLRLPGMPEQTHRQLAELGVDVDQTPYSLSFEDTVRYLARKIAGYDIVVSCQNVADIYPALELSHFRPPLIEHGGLVSEALAGPKHFTSRYVGVCRSIRDAAASHMPGREAHAVEIPSMVDLSAFGAADRSRLRRELGVPEDAPLIGWAGRLDAKKRVEDFIRAASLVHARHPEARFVVIGGPDAFMPEYAEQLKALTFELGLGEVLGFLGDRPDIPQLLGALDIFVWLSRDEGMPHVIAEAGAAGLPVVATADNGTLQQIQNGVSGLFVPHGNPARAAEAVMRLIADPALAAGLGKALRRKVAAAYGTEVVVPQWQRLFEDVLAERRAAVPSLFASFMQGGFECSSHRRPDGVRLDIIASTGHDQHARADYDQLAGLGLVTQRDGFRWHLIETSPGRYDWSSVLPMVRAARDAGVQVIWDLLHYGWPDDIDIWSPAFVRRFAAFAAAAARMVRSETDAVPFYSPINEISFFCWAGGDVAYFNPLARGRGFELKAQLVRAALAAVEAVRVADPRARFVHCDPIISIVADPERPQEIFEARDKHESQFQSWDMLSGTVWPQLGGAPEALDILGVNYYPHNQWILNGPTLAAGDPRRRPLRRLLAETYGRYGRPLFIAETGTEDDRRAGWLKHVHDEACAALAAGVPVEGICLYPVVNHAGWVDERPCQHGLFGARATPHGRSIYKPLAAEVARCVAMARTWKSVGKLPETIMETVA
jgi:glycosyltransferase involved in cell wall biosynthesis